MLHQDFTSSSNNTALQLITGTIGVPDFAKETPLSKEAAAALHRRSFADPILKLFPINSKSATYHSAVFYHGNAEKPDPEVVSRLKSAAVAFGIEEDLENIIGIFEANREVLQKSASSDSQFALEIDHGDGKVDQFYPIGDSYEIEESAKGMFKDACEHKQLFSVLRLAAADLMKAAAEKKVPDVLIPRLIRDLGDDRLVDFDEAARLTSYRCKQAKLSAEVEQIYLDLVKEASENEDLLTANLDLYHKFDIKNGIKYSSMIPCPAEVFFCGQRVADLEKLARETAVVCDVLVPVDVFGRLPDVLLHGNFPKEAAAKLIKLKSASATEITNTLPTLLEKDDEKILLKLLHDTACS